MILKTPAAIILSTVVITVAMGCSGGDDDASLDARLTAQAAGSPPAPTQPPSAGTPHQAAPTSAPTSDPAIALQLRSLGRLVLVPGDFPGVFDTLNNQPASRDSVIAAQAGIAELQAALQSSDLQGAWAALYSNPEPPGTLVSSVIYLFDTPAGAESLVQASGAIEVADYSGAIEAGPEPAPPIGDSSVLMRFLTPEGYSYELTWAQGPAVGQVLVRYEGEPPPDAAQFVIALAEIQAQRMATFVP